MRLKEKGSVNKKTPREKEVEKRKVCLRNKEVLETWKAWNGFRIEFNSN